MRPSRIVAIHQPNFFPWLGYFNKLHRADVFVLMDNVQFPRTGHGSWVNRVRVLVQGQPSWVTMPVVRTFHGTRRIAEMQIDGAPWRERLLRTLQGSYARARHFREVFPYIAELVATPTTSVAEYNTTVVGELAALVGIDRRKLVLGSSLAVEGSATDLLIEMVKAVKGTAYLAGGGAGGYQEDEKFGAAGLALLYQEFQHPVYRQFRSSEFVPGLSILDALMQCGVEGTRRLVRGEASGDDDSLASVLVGAPRAPTLGEPEPS